MKLLHFINAGLWFLNSILWTFYAGSIFMGIASLGTAIITAAVGWKADSWH